MISRRAFLKHSTLLSLAPTVPAFLARTARAARPDPDARVLAPNGFSGRNA